MKPSTILRYIFATLAATPAQGRAKNESLSNDSVLPPTKTVTTAASVVENGAVARGPFVGLFDLENSNISTGEGEPAHWTIPVSHWACTEWTELGDSAIRKAIDAMVEWSTRPTGWIEFKSMHIETAGDAGVFVCNCKYCCNDRAPASEMWEFYERLGRNCGGPGRSGWIFSKRWDKGFAVVSKDYIDGKRTKTNMCPSNCCSHA
ncbi:hypothetical protein GGR52DRAFT_24908 [Hypoxylon sp. FL1284]|nr:hypothetical protein GGR52DRAFT_24908 [Hypoxylon sp. FL1284]